jgi:hypothetical protein
MYDLAQLGGRSEWPPPVRPWPSMAKCWIVWMVWMVFEQNDTMTRLDIDGASMRIHHEEDMRIHDHTSCIMHCIREVVCAASMIYMQAG